MNAITCCKAVLLYLALPVYLFATSMPQITIENKPDSRIEIIPIDKLHESVLPASIISLEKRLPPGAFIIANHSPSSINAVVAVWSYKDPSGFAKPLRVNCDGYAASPVESIVQPNSMVLVTPYSCTKEEYFLNLEPNALFGSPLDPTKLTKVPASESISEIRITVDSVIFSDGEIWGEDKFDYSTEIQERYFAAQEIVSEVTAATEAGEAVKARLVKIHNEAAQKTGRRSFHRANYAALLQRSPNLDGTIQFLQGMTRPSFHHASGDNQE